MEITVTKFAQDYYILDDTRVRESLFIGPDFCLLVDTGFADTALLEKIRKITDKPIRILLTHADGDHTGGLAQFGDSMIMVHPADAHMIHTSASLTEISDDTTIQVGQYHFTVLPIPGHTNGSIALFDEEKGLLISGDSIQDKGPIYMFGSERNMPLYIETLKKLEKISDKIKTIIPSHGNYPLGSESISHCLTDAQDLLEEKLESEVHPVMPCRLCKGTYTSFLYELI